VNPTGGLSDTMVWHYFFSWSFLLFICSNLWLVPW
jgi:hypothetical protein